MTIISVRRTDLGVGMMKAGWRVAPEEANLLEALHRRRQKSGASGGIIESGGPERQSLGLSQPAQVLKLIRLGNCFMGVFQFHQVMPVIRMTMIQFTVCQLAPPERRFLPQPTQSAQATPPRPAMLT